MHSRSIIAVGVDSSWALAGAVDWALQESRFSLQPIRAIHVVDTLPSSGPHFATVDVDQAAQRLAAAVDDYLGAHGGQLRHMADVAAGPPAQTLARAADGLRMLVVGRHGHGHRHRHGVIGRLLIGSTAEEVAHEAKVPVVVVPTPWTPGETAAPIAIGVDESEQCAAAIEFGIGLAMERWVPVRLVHVWDVVGIYTWDVGPSTGTITQWREHHAAQLEHTAQMWREKYPDVTIQTESRRGHPVYALADAVKETAAQLLVLGGRNHSHLVSILLGSTARGVLHHATCPIAIVHEPR